jgi:hypothetical protein
MPMFEIQDVQNNKPINWKFESAEAISAPLDLCFLKGQNVNFQIPEYQVAIISTDGKARRVMLEGSHSYFVDGTGSESLPADGLVYFLNTDHQISVNFDKNNPLVIPGNALDNPVSLTGSIAFSIDNPVLFHKTFLLENICSQSDCSNTVANLLPAWLTITLAKKCGTGTSKEIFHSEIMKLMPIDLNHLFLNHGLSCTEFNLAIINNYSAESKSDLLVT